MIDDPPRLWRRLRVLWQWRRHNAELAEEMAFHLDERRKAFEARGLSPREADAAARRAMGNATAMKEAARHQWLGTWLESVGQDIGYALRSLRRHTTLAGVAILALGGGLGFAAAAFTGVSAFLLRGWDVPESDRVVALFAPSPVESGNRRAAGFSLDQMRLFAEQAQTLRGVFSHERTRSDGTGRLTAAPVSANYFEVLGVPMSRGRAFVADEDRVGAPRAVIVVSHRYWRNALAQTSSVLGSTVRVQGVPFTVVGVAAEGFDGTDVIGVDAWIPLSAMPLVEPRDALSTGALARTDVCCVPVAARLAPGVTYDQVNAELTTLLERSRRHGIDTVARTVIAQPFTVVGSAGPRVMRDVIPIFLLIGGGVGVVLLLACANVANLLLARATARQREIRIRMALGASRARIVRQLMTESLLLALLAMIPALVVARYVPTWGMAQLTDQVLTLQLTPDWRVLLFTVALATVSCVLFGLAPALHATRRLVTTTPRVALRSVFLSAQVTFSLVLLVASALFVRSARAERTLPLGFAADDVMELLVSLPANANAAERGARLAGELSELVNRAGVSPVAYSQFAPFGPEHVTVKVPGVETPPNTRADIPVMYASASYFHVLRIGLVAGRVYRDGADTLAHEVVINAPMAERLGGTARAVGASLLINTVPYSVVGVVPAVRDVGLRDVQPAVYLPFVWQASPRVLVRGNPDGARRLAQRIMQQDPALMVSIKPYARYVADQFSQATFAASVSGALGLLALLLASAGMLGVFSYWVEQRRHEIGVRFALGATPRHILQLVVGASVRAVAWGLVLGLLASAGVAQLLRSSLYGLAPLDLPAFLGASGVLVAAALLATVVPTHRALRIPPMTALRAD